MLLESLPHGPICGAALHTAVTLFLDTTPRQDTPSGHRIHLGRENEVSKYKMGSVVPEVLFDTPQCVYVCDILPQPPDHDARLHSLAARLLLPASPLDKLIPQT